MATKTTKNNSVHRNGWRRYFHTLFFFVVLLSFLPAIEVSARVGCDCSSALWTYSKRADISGTQHTVTCSGCGTWWLENCSYSSQCDTTCNLCLGTRTNAHSYEFTYKSDVTCWGTCTLCGAVVQKNHYWNTETIEPTETTAGKRVHTCSQCGYSYTTDYGSPTGRPYISVPSGGYNPVDSGAMNAYTWDVFKTFRSICIPLAIISLANCGYRFLGAIFTGTYISDSDISKIKKQFLWTMLAILFIFLLPPIFNAAIDFFKVAAWTP